MSDPLQILQNDDNPILTLVMPVYEDANIVIPTIATLEFTIMYPFHLIVVYDYEEDPTVAIIRELQKSFNNIYLVKNEYKKGVINAIKTGFKNARTQYVGIWICYQVDPFGVINEMVRKMLDGYEIISASRFIYKGRFNRGNLIKRGMSKYANKILNHIIGIPLSDATYSMKMYRKDFLDSVPITTKTSGGWALSLELALKALERGLKYYEIPLEKKNLSLMHGVTRFNVRKQLPEYLRWFLWGIKHRKIIKNNYMEHNDKETVRRNG